MNICPDQEQAYKTEWLQAVHAFCQERGAASLQIGQPAQRILVQWPIADQPTLVVVTVSADVGLLFLLPLGTVPPSDRQAALMAAGAVNFHHLLACLEVEPLSGEARVRVTVTVGDRPAVRLLELAFRALEEAAVVFIKGIAAFKEALNRATQQALQAQPEEPLPSSLETLARLWNGRQITD